MIYNTFPYYNKGGRVDLMVVMGGAESGRGRVGGGIRGVKTVEV